MQEKQYIEDEIDLRELFNTIWEQKLFVVLFTLFVTLSAGIYVFVKTPIYEVKSTIEIGFIAKENTKDEIDKLIEEENILEQKLNAVFNSGSKNINNDSEKGIVSSISQNKIIKKFIDITTQAVSNEIAMVKNKEILEYAQKLYEPKIERYKTLINNEILIIDNEINFLKNEKLQVLIEKVKSTKFNLEKYNKQLDSLSKLSIKSNDKSSSLIVSMQILNYQNLIDNTKNIIKDSSLEIELILKDTIPKLQQKKEVIKIKLNDENLTNTRLVGDYIISEYPVKPKKALIIVVSFVTGFILSIFLVFSMQFISSIRKGL